MDKLTKVKYIDMPKTKRERNFLKEMTLANGRLWFRYRCQTIVHIKGNKSSVWRNNMACRLCTSGEDETQDHLERCNFTKEMRENLNLTLREDKIVWWRKITRSEIIHRREMLINRY